MGAIMCVHGGAGSATIITRARELTGDVVHGRPDVAFFPHDTPPITTSWRDGAQVLSRRGYEDLPSASAAALFERRAPGYPLDRSLNIDENLDRYLSRIAGSDDHTLLCRAPCLGFLCAHRGASWLPSVVAVVREPLAQFTSFMKPERHEDWSHSFGGVCTPGAVDFFVAGWTSFVRDCVDAGVRIVRFEHAPEDAAGHPLLERVLEGWNGSRRSRSPLTPELEARLQAGTGEVWAAAQVAAQNWRRPAPV